MSEGFYSGSAFNRLTNLDNIEYKIVDFLAKSDSKYANYLWKILKYDEQDCLSRENLSYKDKMALVYSNNGESTRSRVFMTPYIDDSWDEQSSHLHVYVNRVIPKNRLTANVEICFELVVHNKIGVIYGDASEFNSESNPVELKDGAPVILYKNRASEMLKDVVGALNGQMVNGVGMLQFNMELNPEERAASTVWNGKKFYGYKLTMTTIMSGVSQTDDCGW